MGIKWNYVLGVTTITVIIGGVGYAIYKAKQLEKSEEESISLEEAREIVARGREVDPSAVPDDYEKGLNTVVDSVAKSAEDILKPKIIRDEENEFQEKIDEEDLLHDAYPHVYESVESPPIEPLIDFSYIEEGIDPKEDVALRFDPNSVEAKHQYIRMELADWSPDQEVYRIMLQLFEFKFTPKNDGDEVLRTQIIDHKVQFFGFSSKWVKEVSFADILFHYARSAEYNCGESVVYWIEYFLEFNDFQWDSTSRYMDELIDSLSSHSYFNELTQSFGLFGLTREQMNNAISIANMNIDRSVTYEIEFNEFLKSIV